MLQSPTISVVLHKPRSSMSLSILYWWGQHWILSLSLPNTAQNATGLLCYKATLMIPLLPAFHKDPHVFFLPSCFPAVWPSTWSAYGVLHPIYRTLHLPLLYSMSLLSAPFFILLRYFWIAALLSIVQTSHNPVSLENLLHTPSCYLGC